VGFHKGYEQKEREGASQIQSRIARILPSRICGRGKAGREKGGLLGKKGKFFSSSRTEALKTECVVAPPKTPDGEGDLGKGEKKKKWGGVKRKSSEMEGQNPLRNSCVLQMGFATIGLGNLSF